MVNQRSSLKLLRMAGVLKIGLQVIFSIRQSWHHQVSLVGSYRQIKRNKKPSWKLWDIPIWWIIIRIFTKGLITNNSSKIDSMTAAASLERNMKPWEPSEGPGMASSCPSPCNLRKTQQSACLKLLSRTKDRRINSPPPPSNRPSTWRSMNSLLWK